MTKVRFHGPIAGFSGAMGEMVFADPETRAFYEAIAEQRDSNAHAVAVTDFLVAPQFKPLNLAEYKGHAGDPILIRATDNIGLADVEVTLTADDGTQIEKGKPSKTAFIPGTGPIPPRRQSRSARISLSR